MWLSGIGIEFFERQNGLTNGQLLDSINGEPDVFRRRAVIAGVVSLALVIAGCIALIYRLLTRLTTRPIAFTGAFLLALDPFHLAASKVLHLDGLLSVLMLVSALALQEQGEGLDLAAGYLNSLPGAADCRAAVFQGLPNFRSHFAGVTVSSFRDEEVNYRVYYLNHVLRRMEPKVWEPSWNSDRQGEPFLTVAFDSVTCVWVYRKM